MKAAVDWLTWSRLAVVEIRYPPQKRNIGLSHNVKVNGVKGNHGKDAGQNGGNL